MFDIVLLVFWGGSKGVEPSVGRDPRNAAAIQRLPHFARPVDVQLAEFLRGCEEESAVGKDCEGCARVAIWDPNLQC